MDGWRGRQRQRGWDWKWPGKEIRGCDDGVKRKRYAGRRGQTHSARCVEMDGTGRDARWESSTQELPRASPAITHSCHALPVIPPSHLPFPRLRRSFSCDTASVTLCSWSAPRWADVRVGACLLTVVCSRLSISPVSTNSPSSASPKNKYTPSSRFIHSKARAHSASVLAFTASSHPLLIISRTRPVSPGLLSTSQLVRI